MAVGSFSAGLSGLSSNSIYLSVIGNNLANINTVGYKASSVAFSDLVSQTIEGPAVNAMQVGLGVNVGSISPVFSQGSIERTQESSNVAIQGSGFFVVAEPNGQGNAYTRAGNFSFDADGALVTPEGWLVQGYTQTDPITGAIVASGQLGDIVVPPGVLRPPVSTTSISTLTNLQADVPITGATNFTTAVQIYDSLGAPHVLDVAFERTGAGAWNYTVTVPAVDVTGTAGAPITLATGTLTFDGTGRLTAPATDVTIPAPASWANGATPNAITWTLYRPPNNEPMLTSYSQPSATSSSTQNGSAAGRIESVSISADGSIVASFGAGQSVIVAQLALANFNNPKGLIKQGANLYGESQAAGLPSIGTAGTGGRGTVIGSALEQSNVDIAREFTNMILAQRGYQANARSITVSDELLVETLQLKR
jgi:flagellar hook protein FlgE